MWYFPSATSGEGSSAPPADDATPLEHSVAAPEAVDDAACEAATGASLQSSPSLPGTLAHHLDIRCGQVYVSLDGQARRLEVVSIEPELPHQEVLVRDIYSRELFRINGFRLVRFDYALESDTMPLEELLSALSAGQATAQQQKEAGALLYGRRRIFQEQQADVRRGRLAVAEGAWRRTSALGERDATWLAVRVLDGADLSCPGTRASALDAVIAQNLEKRAAAGWPPVGLNPVEEDGGVEAPGGSGPASL